MKSLNLPDLPSVSTPDIGGVADELLDLANAAADAVSSAAGHVPGLDDYRAGGRRKLFLSIGAIAVVLVVIALVQRRRSSDDGESNN